MVNDLYMSVKSKLDVCNNFKTVLVITMVHLLLGR